MRIRFEKMTDAEVYELHRVVAREAQARRQHEPRYQQNYKAGVAAGRAKWERYMAKVL